MQSNWGKPRLGGSQLGTLAYAESGNTLGFVSPPVSPVVPESSLAFLYASRVSFVCPHAPDRNNPATKTVDKEVKGANRLMTDLLKDIDRRCDEPTV